MQKKIGYETKSYQYDVDSDKAKRARYDGMIEHVQAWSPVYKNDADKGLEKEAVAYFAGRKKFALSQLDGSKRFDCHSESWSASKKEAYFERIATLQETNPADFADMFQYNATNRINSLTAQIAKKDPKLQGDK